VLQVILDDGPFEEVFTLYSPLKGQSATFSMKFNSRDSFLFDGTMAKGR
jgi:hypothetical protein